MCLPETPDIPEPPPPVQELKTPDTTAMAKARKKGSAMAGGTLLTSPSGITQAALNTGSTTLLGG